MQPLLDVVYTTEYNLQDGVPVCHTEQQPFTATVEEVPASPARLPSTPPCTLPAAPLHVGSSLKQKFRTVALLLAAHLRRVLVEAPTRFSFRCIRDAHGHFCISSLCVPDAAQQPGSPSQTAPHSLSTPPRPSWPARPAAAPFQPPLDATSMSQTGCVADQLGTARLNHAAVGAPRERLGRVSGAHRLPQRPVSAHIAPGPRSGSLQSMDGRPRPQTARTPATSRFRQDASFSLGGSTKVPHRGGLGQGPRTGAGEPLDGQSLKSAVDRQGVPRVVEALAGELEIMRGELVIQHELLESHCRRANKAEYERQVRSAPGSVYRGGACGSGFGRVRLRWGDVCVCVCVCVWGLEGSASCGREGSCGGGGGVHGGGRGAAGVRVGEGLR